MADPDLLRHVDAVRRFNRFYTSRIGALQEGLLESPFSLTEARVLYELAHGEHVTASDICAMLRLDPGYLSRILRDFRKQGLVDTTPSSTDGRRSILRLTREGKKAFAKLDRGARSEVTAMLGKLPAAGRERLVGAMEAIEHLLDSEPKKTSPYILRRHRPGDIGWVVYRHGALYAQEYGWNEEFEALVAEIAAKFLKGYDPMRERCWIAEMDGENVGSVFLVRKSATVAKLRLLLVEPKARGLGLGAHLVDECLRFARETGYRKVTLWTNDVLHAARHIYESAGFHLVHEEAHHSFGHDQVGQTWEIAL